MILKMWYQHENGDRKDPWFHTTTSLRLALDMYPSHPPGTDKDPGDGRLPESLFWDLRFHILSEDEERAMEDVL